jgi:uncharacterized CHY-type Zn-finger protein
MPPFRCPGQDLRQWTPDDIYDVICPHCRNDIEFFKDEPALTCPKCKQRVRNPKLNIGCAEWCQYADDCLGILKDSS